MIPGRAWVLNMEHARYRVFDPVAAETVKRVLDAARAKIVISSTWRSDGQAKCVELLEENGIDRHYLHQDWRTPTVKQGGAKAREAEIYLWLAKHPEVEKFAVLDDTKMNLSNMVHVDFSEGILSCHQKALFAAFGVAMQ
jgi:hypothetical protein